MSLFSEEIREVLSDRIFNQLFLGSNNTIDTQARDKIVSSMRISKAMKEPRFVIPFLKTNTLDFASN
jgi:ribosome maturation protein Sdo1